MLYPFVWLYIVRIFRCAGSTGRLEHGLALHIQRTIFVHEVFLFAYSILVGLKLLSRINVMLSQLSQKCDGEESYLGEMRCEGKRSLLVLAALLTILVMSLFVVSEAVEYKKAAETGLKRSDEVEKNDFLTVEMEEWEHDSDSDESAVRFI